jgi:hypothetical protein
MNTTNETRRDVMATARGMFRADPARGFAVAPTGAWRWITGRATLGSEPIKLAAESNA